MVRKINIVKFAKEVENNMNELSISKNYINRDVNLGFSGGEKKKNEILQMLMLQPKLAILDETDSGLDVDAIRVVSQGIEEYKKRTNGSLLVITHSTKIVENLHVDYAHGLVKGKIVKTGDQSLIKQINESGFEQFMSQD